MCRAGCIVLVICAMSERVGLSFKLLPFAAESDMVGSLVVTESNG